MEIFLLAMFDDRRVRRGLSSPSILADVDSICGHRQPSLRAKVILPSRVSRALGASMRTAVPWGSRQLLLKRDLQLHVFRCNFRGC